ncbi:anther-specific protein lat52 [Phtheirospermum japonicum]|uniref:Anther-specific protein lat52 n=1 Tax=Phtheirospermum japonicum TaxID=374723 RepID=A0A830CJQ7_9LAMI|nr:anther-specific protein lat52 [Phtheirospermum japonicum]
MMYYVDGVTDSNGKYNLQVTEDHETKDCYVKAISSPKPDCSEPLADFGSRRSSSPRTSKSTPTYVMPTPSAS